MEKYTNKYEVALAIAEKFGSTNDHLSNIFEALLEIGQLRGLSVEGYSNKYDVLRALALNEGVSEPLSNMYECLVGLAGIYGGTNFSNNYEAALYLLENAEAGFGGMCFTAVTSGSIGMSHHGTNETTTIPRLQYSRDGETWTDWMFESLSLNAGEKIYFKGINNAMATSTANYSNFAITGQVKASGNIMSLLYSDDYKDHVSLANKNYCFYNLFGHQAGLVSSPKLPATTLAVGVYWNMFAESGLLEMPELPATDLALSCYSGMFRGCTSLTRTKVLPAKTLTIGAYLNMFNGCSNLSEVTAYFTSNPAQSNTGNWLDGVAAEGTFRVAADADWVDDLTYSGTTVPEGWTIVGRTPRSKVNVSIDGTIIRLWTDRTFAEQGYTELYSQAEYYPRFGQHYYDFTYNTNSYPMSGLEVFTTCTPAVHMINVTVDGAATQVNYYTSWFANGFNELYADNEFESESEVEEIDVDTTYPNEGDTVYTSYIIVPQWMKQAAAAYNIPVMNIYNANKDYRFVDYLESTGSQVVIQLGNTGSNNCGIKIKVKNDSYVADSTFIGSRQDTSASRFTIGTINNHTYFGTGASYSLTDVLVGGESYVYEFNYLNDRKFRNGDISRDISTITTQTYPISVFGYTRYGEVVATSAIWSVYYTIFTRGNSIESVYLPAINANGTAIMLDLKTMNEYENSRTGEIITGSEMSLEDKFSEIL